MRPVRARCLITDVPGARATATDSSRWVERRSRLSAMPIGPHCPHCGWILRPLQSDGPLAPAEARRYCPLCIPTPFFAAGPLAVEPLPPVIERAARGAHLLDRAQAGWAGEVDAERLDMASMESGVLEQLWGTYRAGFREAIRPLRCDVRLSAADFGFWLHNREGSMTGDPVGAILRYRELTEAWRVLIEARR